MFKAISDRFPTTRAGRRSATLIASVERLNVESNVKENEHREKLAANRLALALKMKHLGEVVKYSEWLKQIVDEYPETTSAKTARQLLATLETNK